jgi:hypothetical protein
VALKQVAPGRALQRAAKLLAPLFHKAVVSF